MNARRQVLLGRAFANSGDGNRELMKAARASRNRGWAVEGSNGVGKHLTQRLVAQHETVFDVTTRKSSRVRAFAADSGRKTDELDAHSVALVGWTTQHLPQVRGE